MVLYPLSAFRAQCKAAIEVFEAIKRDDSQHAVVDEMQTRKKLYECPDYHSYEDKIDALFCQ